MLSENITATDYIDGDTETKNVIINPLVSESSTGITTTFIDFSITSEGVYYMDNTVLSMTVEIENTTDHTIEYFSRFRFINDNLNTSKFNLAICNAQVTVKLNAKENVTDHFDFAYSGESDDFYSARQMQFDTVLSAYEVPLINKYDICFQELQAKSLTN